MEKRSFLKRFNLVCNIKGASRTPEYSAWYDMHRRCLDEKCHAFERYGGRGIKVCDEWKTFDNFIEDVGKRPTKNHSLDRIDNEQGYNSANCKWETAYKQSVNRRNTLRIDYQGKSWTITELSKAYGLTYNTLRMRLYRGLPIEEALTIKYK